MALLICSDGLQDEGGSLVAALPRFRNPDCLSLICSGWWNGSASWVMADYLSESQNL